MDFFRTSLVLLSLAICCTQARMLVGGWTTKQPYSNPRYSLLAHYALLSEASNGKFYYAPINLLKVQTQVVAGINYRLVFTVAETNCRVRMRHYSIWHCPPIPHKVRAICTAVVYERPWQKYIRVTSFKCSQCGASCRHGPE